MRVVLYILAFCFGWVVTMAFGGAVYSSRWLFDGKDVTTLLKQPPYVGKNVGEFRELHTVDLDGFIEMFTGAPSHLVPALSWQTEVAGFSGWYLAANVLLFALISACLIIAGECVAARVSNRRGQAT